MLPCFCCLVTATNSLCAKKGGEIFLKQYISIFITKGELTCSWGIWVRELYTEKTK
jgi:hypothetical protein